MNLKQVVNSSRKNTELYCNNDTRLSGYKLTLARAVWLALFSLIFIVYFMGFPEAFKLALLLRPETVAGLERFGIPVSFPAVYTISLDTVTILVFACFAALIVWRRSDDWMVMFAIPLTRVYRGLNTGYWCLDAGDRNPVPSAAPSYTTQYRPPLLSEQV